MSDHNDEDIQDKAVLAPSDEYRNVLPLKVDAPRFGPSFFACSVSPTKIGCDQDADEFYFLKEDNDTGLTYICCARREHELYDVQTTKDTLKKSNTENHWKHYQLPHPLPDYCKRATTQLILNWPATMLAVLSTNHLVVYDVSANHKVSGANDLPRHITLVQKSSTSFRTLRSCSWHPTLDNVLVVMDDVTISLYYFWEAAIAAHLSPSSNQGSFAEVFCTDEGHYCWLDELELPRVSAYGDNDPFSCFCFGDQDTLDTIDSVDNDNNVSWEPFTIYVLHRNGGIYAACPVAPRGLVIDDEKIEILRDALNSNKRYDWIDQNWSKCKYFGEDESDWKCLNFQVQSEAWYEASDNQNSEHNRPDTLEATSLVSIRGCETIKNSNIKGYPILVRSWSNGEIDTILVHEPADGRPASIGYAPLEVIGVICLARNSTFIDTPKPFIRSRVGIILDEMDDNVIYIIGAYEINRLVISPLDVFRSIENSGKPPQKIWDPLTCYYPSSNDPNKKVEGVVPYTLRPGEQCLRIFQTDGTVIQMNVSTKMFHNKLKKEEEIEEKIEEHLKNKEQGDQLLRNEEQRYLKEQMDELENVITSTWGGDMNETGIKNQFDFKSMDSTSVRKILLFTEKIDDKFLRPMNNFKNAYKKRTNFLNRLWIIIKLQEDGIKKKVSIIRAKAKEVKKLKDEILTLSKRNLERAKDITDLVLSYKGNLNEEETDWFDTLKANNVDMQRKRSQYNEWMKAEHMIWKPEQVGSVLFEKLLIKKPKKNVSDESYSDDDETLDSEEVKESKEIKVIGDVLPNWKDESQLQCIMHFVMWEGQKEQGPFIIQEYESVGERNCRMNFNINFPAIPEGTLLKIVKKTLTFSEEKLKAINEDRRRLEREMKLDKLHNIDIGSDTTNAAKRKKDDDLANTRIKNMEKELEKIEKKIMNLEEQIRNGI
jgi:hypothetical protein